jgi:predicted RNA-binding Zn-ribbon protein involved in translation (DUF1610 family)/transposase-like protein
MAKVKPFTIKDLMDRFPDDDACLDHLMHARYGSKVKCPKCGKAGRFSRIRKMPAFACPWCGHHIHPMAGTPFELTRTPLQKWFYVMYLFTTTRNGVSAKEIQRQIGCTYKTAWRMGHEIRKYMGAVDGEGPLGGRGQWVEADEVQIGGHDKRGHDDKTIVFGMVERGHEVVTRVVPDRRRETLVPIIRKVVRPATQIATDNAYAYRELNYAGYRHQSVDHVAKSMCAAPFVQTPWTVSGRGYSAALPKRTFGYLLSIFRSTSGSSSSGSIFGRTLI